MDEKKKEDEFRKAVGAWKRLMAEGISDGNAKRECTADLTRLFDDGEFETLRDGTHKQVSSRDTKAREDLRSGKKEKELNGKFIWDRNVVDDSGPLTLKEGAEYVGVTYSAESVEQQHPGVAAPDSTMRSVGKSGSRVSPGAVTVGAIPMRAIDGKSGDSVAGGDEDDVFGNREDYYDGSEEMRRESLKRCYKKAMSYGCSRVMTSVPDSVDPVTAVPFAETTKGTEADGTSGLTMEIVENLEKHINQQRIIIENYKEALSKKSLKCRKLLAELIRLKEQNNCSTEKQIEACVEKAIAIINDIRTFDAGKKEVQDETKEMRALRLENMNLKVVILELVEQIKQKQGSV